MLNIYIILKWTLEFLSKYRIEESYVFIKEIFDKYINYSIIKKMYKDMGVYPMGI